MGLWWLCVRCLGVGSCNVVVCVCGYLLWIVVILKWVVVFVIVSRFFLLMLV